jgi:hypothetical protein
MKLAITLALALVGTHANAQTAPTKRQCADAYTQAQVLRSQDKLVLAKEQVDLCNDPACPQALRKDCNEWLVELQDSVPTLTIDAVTESGRAPSSARVTVDGNDVANGASVPLDPGPHAIAAEATGLRQAVETVTLLKGEKRHVTLTLAAPPAPIKTWETRPLPSRPFPVAPIVVGIAGLALVGSFAAFGLVGNAKRGCTPNCSPGDLDAIRTDYIVGDVLLGLGVTAVAVATLWLILYETAPAPKRAMAWRSLALGVRF